MQNSRKAFAAIVVLSALFALLLIPGCAPANNLTYCGMSFAIPDDWTANLDGNNLTVDIPGSAEQGMAMTGGRLDQVVAEGQEEEALTELVKGTLGVFGKYSNELRSPEVIKGNVGGIPTVKLKCTLYNGSESQLHVYVLGWVYNQRVATLTMGSLGGVLDEQFESIISSARAE